MDRDGSQYLTASILTALLLALGLIWKPEELLNHWFVIPMFAWGFVFMKDMTDWATGKLDTFDPLAIIAFFQLRGFVGTLIKLNTGQWLNYVEYPPDWRPWVGLIAILNCVSYVVMKFACIFVGRRFHWNKYYARVIDVARYSSILPLLVAAGLTAGTYLLVSFGGMEGYVNAFEKREGFSGLGLLLMLVEPLPILVFIAYVLRTRQYPELATWTWICVALGALFVLVVAIGGLRGSRSNVIWNVFWAAGIIHFGVRPIPRKAFVLAAVCGLGFIYTYSFYKHFGVEGFVEAITSVESRQEMARSDRGEGSWYQRLAGGGTGTYTLYRILRSDRDYEFADGRTYTAAAFRFIPRFIYANRPAGKRKYGTDVLYGQGTWPSKESSLVWGLQGEAMLNFGPWVSPILFIIPGIVLAYSRHLAYGIDQNDARVFLIPLWIFLTVNIIGSDSESLPFIFFKNGLLPIALIYFSSVGVSNANQHEGCQVQPLPLQ